jgi:GAF domain-containing protein
MGWRQWLAGLARRLNGSRSTERVPFSSGCGECLAVPASILEDLAALLVKAAAEEVQIEELCACAARLSKATGCALMEWDSLAGESRIHAAVGTWEESPLRPILEGAAPDWAFALGGAPVCACREGGTVRAFRWDSGPRNNASGLAMPMVAGDKTLGALLTTYPAPRAFTAEEVRIARLVACHATLMLRHRELAATVEHQARRIARLVDDVERMLIALRRAAAQDDPAHRA